MSGPDSLRVYIKNSSPITSNLFLYGQHEKGILTTGEKDRCHSKLWHKWGKSERNA